MTREEAITKIFKEHGVPTSNPFFFEILKALEQEPCDDCISRQATVERLCKVAEFMNEKRNGLGSPYVMAALFIKDNKDEFPPVTPKPKTGHWKPFDLTFGRNIYYCTECLMLIDMGNPMFKYCPNCGAKMESEGKK